MTSPALTLIWVAPDEPEPKSTSEPDAAAPAVGQPCSMPDVDDDPMIIRAWELYAVNPHDLEVRNELVTRLYTRYRKELIRIARHRLNDPNADIEVVQAVFISLLDKLRSSAGARFFCRDLRGWLRQTTRNKAQNVNRSRSRLSARLERFTHHCRVFFHYSSRRRNADTELDGPRRDTAIRHFLDQLDEETREIVLLRSRHCSRREIAASIGISESTVGRRLARLRDKLRIRARRDPLLAELLDEISETDRD